MTPANPSVAKGATQQFTATGTYSDSTTQDLTGQVTWASATTAVATINTAGLAPGSRRAPPRSGHAGRCHRLDGADGHRRGAAVDRRDAGNPSVAKGPTQQFTATGTFSDNSTKNLTSQVTWASANTDGRLDHRDAGLATGAGGGHVVDHGARWARHGSTRSRSPPRRCSRSP